MPHESWARTTPALFGGCGSFSQWSPEAYVKLERITSRMVGGAEKAVPLGKPPLISLAGSGSGSGSAVEPVSRFP